MTAATRHTEPLMQVLCDCGAHSECLESQVPDECPGCGEQPLCYEIEDNNQPARQE